MRLAAALAAACVLAGCATSVQPLTIPDPPATTVAPPAPPSTLAPGLAAVAEIPVAGTTTTTAPALGPGPATLDGTVLGPSGPVPGATVQADRIVGDQVVSARTVTAADGSFVFRDVLGGRYRVRAWLAPSLDLQVPSVLFLVPGQPSPLTLQLTLYSGQQVQAAINPALPVEGSPADLAVQVTSPTVTRDGLLVDQPVVGTPVTLVDGPGWQVLSANPEPTGASGEALFSISCTTAGADPLSASAGASPPVALQMPPCAPPPTTTVPTTTGPTTAGATTTTTCPPPPTVPGEPSTTTTTLLFGGC